MSETGNSEIRIADRRPLTPELRGPIVRWHMERGLTPAADDDWVELLCGDANLSLNSDRIVVAAPPTAAKIGELIDVGHARQVGTLLPPSPFASPPDKSVPGTAMTAFDAALEAGPVRMLFAPRLDYDGERWVAVWEQPYAGPAYGTLLAELETIYPDEGDPSRMVELARAALGELAAVPTLAARHDSTLEPSTVVGVIWRVRGAGPLVVLPLIVVLQWALALRDAALLDELDAALAPVTELERWRETCRVVRGHLGTSQRVIEAIESGPGVLQTELAVRLELDAVFMRELAWVLEWARVIRREKDGRSNRLYPA